MEYREVMPVGYYHEEISHCFPDILKHYVRFDEHEELPQGGAIRFRKAESELLSIGVWRC